MQFLNKMHITYVNFMGFFFYFFPPQHNDDLEAELLVLIKLNQLT